MEPKPTAIIYVDAFNLYYGALKGTEFKWLDLEKLFDRLLPGYNVTKIYYFTARLRQIANPRDPDAPLRQKTYLNALTTLKRVNVVFGNFMVHPSMAPKRRSSRLWGIKCPSYGCSVQTQKFGK